MFRILEAQAPAKQTATDTIATLCGRLQSATLLEDRRASILGLRSFAKQFPASVASGALRNLIDTLRTQREDPDTTKTVLETLLMLFDPDPTSPEASEDIMMWLADEFSMKQENITALLDLLEQHDFFSRLYSLQLISSVSKARPERTQECVMMAPLGTTRLVSVLDDTRDAVRTECLLLLNALTPGNSEFQKQVVFESAFDRIFKIIEQEGGLVDGGIVVQDGLELSANLLRLNSSNQMDFRETGGPKRISNLLKPIVEPLKPAEGEEQPASWNIEQRDRNLWGMFSIIGLFLMDKGSATQRNQGEFWKAGVTQLTVEIAFKPDIDTRIQAKALGAVSDLIRRNQSLQEQFAQKTVRLNLDNSQTPLGTPQANGHANGHKAEENKNIIQALLDLSLNVSKNWNLELRLAAGECLKAYLQGHLQIRQYFLNRACEGHQAGVSEPDNVLSTMLEVQDSARATDPYRQWMASVVFLHLIDDDHELKKRAREVQEGDEAAGDEVVTCIQTLASNLVALASRETDERPTVSYLMVLSSWLFEDPDAVNDFLQEGSNLQGLTTMVHRAIHHQPIVAGLTSFLLGIIYEFSTKDSPIPRSTIHNILINKLGRDLYTASLTRLREDPAVRDFEVEPAADPLFDASFVEFFKDNFSRIVRAVDREPDIEVSVKIGGVEKGVSREQVDSLRAQLEEHSQSLEEALDTIQNLERQLGQEQANHRRDRESSELEVKRVSAVNAELQRNHESELQRLKSSHQQVEVESRSKHAMEIKSLRDQMNQMQRAHESETQNLKSNAAKEHANAKSASAVELQKITRDLEKRIADAANQREIEVAQLRNELQKQAADAINDSAKEREGHEAEVSDLKKRLAKAEKALDKANKEHSKDLKTAYDEHKESKDSLEGRLKRAEQKAAEAEKREKEARKANDAKSKTDKVDKDTKAKIEKLEKETKSKIEKAEKEAKEKEEARAAVQTELDDLFVVLGDLEEKRSKDKARLKELGEEVSDDGEDDDDDEDDDGDGDDVD